MRQGTLTILLLSAALATPTAFATWSAKGAYEPDTAVDVLLGFNHFEPDTTVTAAGVSKVYFNAIQGVSTVAAGLSINPNVAAARSQMGVFDYQARAILGVWKDCNKDGFVGFGDQGLWEYRVDLLGVPGANGVAPLDSVCKSSIIPTPIPRDWKPVHNDGTWVHEFLPIGWDVASDPAHGCATCVDVNPWNIRDDAARVWGDYGIPDPTATVSAGSGCYFLAHPKGSFDSVGATMDLLDCFLGGALAGAGDTIGTAPGGAGAWTTLRDTQNPWGREEDASYATGFDCTAAVVGPTRVGGSEVFVTVPRPGVPAPNGDGSIGGTLNETETQFGDCQRNDKDSASAKNLPYSTETDVSNDGASAAKSVHDFPMVFQEGCRVNAVPAVPSCNVERLGRGAPGAGDLGTRTSAEGMWTSTNIGVGGGFGFPQQVSFYAFVSPAAVTNYGLTLPKGTTTGKYGSDACTTGMGTGAASHGGWACDPAQWWPEGESGRTNMATVAGTPTFIGVRVTQDYNFRDTDCYDQGVGPQRENGLTYGQLVPTLTGGAANECA